MPPSRDPQSSDRPSRREALLARAREARDRLAEAGGRLAEAGGRLAEAGGRLAGGWASGSTLPRWRDLPVGLWLARLAIAAAAFAFVLLIAWDRCLPGSWCPDVVALAAYQPDGAPVLLDRNGEEIGDLHPLQQRVIPLDSVPEHLPEALIAVEDRRFHEHRGVDWLRLPAAALRGQGGSTITMQLARTLFPDLLPRDQRTLRRKLQEVRVAQEIERVYGKREILELYLNHVYLGSGNYGSEEASRHLFGRSAVSLSLEQAALLAGMARAPASYDPRRHPDRARDRRNLVLRLMGEQRLIEPELAREAAERPLAILESPLPEGSERAAPYFVEEVRAWLRERFDEELLRSPARIYTSLDLRTQVIAEEELRAQLERIERGAFGEFTPRGEAPEGLGGEGSASGTTEIQGAVVVLDPFEGDLLALVGGRDFDRSAYNRASWARRQVGSAFKPFVYGAALSEGFLQSQPIADVPFQVTLVDSEPWSPRNYDGRFRGHTNMREALVHSVNVPTARMAMAVGIDAVVDFARSAGIDAPIPVSPAIALGAATLTPLELTAAYTSFAALGDRVAVRLVLRIENAEGEVVHLEEPRREAAFDPRVAYIVTDMLKDVVDRGTGAEVRSAGYGALAAGKTGTTQDARDAWFVGYTPDLVGTVWIGFDQPREIVPGSTGGRLAAPLWGRIMDRIYTERPTPDPWQMPDGIVETEVDRASGMYVREGCSPTGGGAIRVLFLEEHQPAATCPVEQGWLDRLASFLGIAADDVGGELPMPEQSDAFHLDASVERILGATRVPGTGAGS